MEGILDNIPEDKFRVIEIDVRAATDFPGTEGADNCCKIIEDCENLPLAVRIGQDYHNSIPAPFQGRYHVQIHDHKGECVYYICSAYEREIRK